MFFLLLLVFVPKLLPSLCLQKKERKKERKKVGFCVWRVLFHSFWQQRVIQTLFPRSPNPSRVGKEERKYLIRTEKKRKKLGFVEVAVKEKLA